MGVETDHASRCIDGKVHNGTPGLSSRIEAGDLASVTEGWPSLERQSPQRLGISGNKQVAFVVGTFQGEAEHVTEVQRYEPVGVVGGNKRIL